MKLVSKDRISVMNIHYANYSLDYFLDVQAELGVKNVELLGGHQGMWIDHKGYADTAPIRRKLEERGLKCPIITPEGIDYQYQYSGQSKELFERSYRFFANGVRMGAELGAKILMANSGWGYWTEDYEEGMKRTAEMFSRLSELCAEFDMEVAFESLRPQESHLCCDLKSTKDLIDRVNHPRCKAMLDLTAMEVAGETIEDWYAAFGPEKINHAHFVDGNPYGHLVWGEGHRNLEQCLNLLNSYGYTGYFSQELTDSSYYADPKSVDTRNMRMWSLYTE